MEQKDIYILGIESSCDDTSAAVLRNGVLLSNVTASQDVHMAYGGVVPELASRAHQQNVVPVVDQAIKRAGITKDMLSAVAFTRGPGLMGSLLVGVSFAKGFARSLGIPLIDVNHLQGHVMAHFIKESDDDNSAPPLPFLCRKISTYRIAVPNKKQEPDKSLQRLRGDCYNLFACFSFFTAPMA